MAENVIYSINGPVVKVKDTTAFSMLERVLVGKKKLMGEVISISRSFTTIQVYESTTGPDAGRRSDPDRIAGLCHPCPRHPEKYI